MNAAIMRMLAKNPEDRWPSVKDAVAAIAAVAPPVDEDVRARIIALARNRPDRAAIEFRTPPSPAPPPRRTPSQPPEGFVERRVSGANTPPQIQIIHKAAAWPIVVGGILALVAGGFYWQTRTEATAAQQQDSLAANTTTMGRQPMARGPRQGRSRSSERALGRGKGGSPDLGGLAPSLGGVSRRDGTEGGRRRAPQSGGNRLAIGGSNGAPPCTNSSALSHRLAGRADHGAGAAGIPAQSAGRHRAARGNRLAGRRSASRFGAGERLLRSARRFHRRPPAGARCNGFGPT